MTVGFYCIQNLETGWLYVGSASVSMEVRWNRHKYDLIPGRHPNKRLQMDWDSYGPSSFRFSILRLCTPNECIATEQYYIDSMDPRYNVLRVAGSHLGAKRSPETCARIRAVKLGKPSHKQSPETREKIRASSLGRHLSASARAKVSCAQKGRPKSESHRAKISASLMGRAVHPMTPEIIAKIKASKMRSKILRRNIA